MVNNKPEKTVLLAAQEVSFARFLASNQVNIRDRALKRLKQWLISKSNEEGFEFTEEGFMRIWKGLIYCLYMSDKPLIQEQCVDSISNLVHSFARFNDVLKFQRCFFQALSQAWFGIDNARIDKFLMLVRRCLRQWLSVMAKGNWKKSQVTSFAEECRKGMILAPLGFNLHFTEVYLEEVAKVGQGELSHETVLILIKPFGQVMAEVTDTRFINHISKHVFIQLMKQSEEGIVFDMKYEAWKEMGFPGGDINLIEEVDPAEDSDEDETDEDAGSPMEVDEGKEDESLLDPRAGKVDVVLPQIGFNPKSIKDFLIQLKTLKDTTTRARKAITGLISRYAKFESGKFPLGVQKLPVVEKDDEDLDEAVKRLNEDLKDIENKEGDDDLEDLSPVKRKKNVWDVSDFDFDSNNSSLNSSGTGAWSVTDSLNDTNEEINTKKKTKHKQGDEILISKGNVFLETDIKNGVQVPYEVTINNSTPQSENDLNSSIGHTPMPKGNKRKRKEALQGPSCNDSTPTFDNNFRPSRITSSPKVLQSKSKKIQEKDFGVDNSWGSKDWDGGETEIVIPCPSPYKRLKGKGRRSFISSPQHVNTSLTNKIKNGTPGSGKKVNFVLARNTAQEATEYKRALKEKPLIPYDAEKKPIQGVLKPTSIESPINPFYRHIVSPLHTKKYF